MPSTSRVPRYVSALREQAGERCAALHLGYWADPTDATTIEAAQNALEDILLERAAIAGGHAVLDVACGLGHTLERLRARMESAHLVGVDVDPRNVEHARRVLKSSVELCAADACALPFADASFDRILCVEAAFHFASRRAFLVEARRVLAADGRIALSDYVAADDFETRIAKTSLPFDSIERCLLEDFGPWSEMRTPLDYPGLAEECGLRVLSVEDITHNTHRSYREFGVETSARDASLRARSAAALAELHELGALRMLLVVLEIA